MHPDLLQLCTEYNTGVRFAGTRCIYRVAQKTSRALRNYNGACTLLGEISFGTFVDHYVLLLTYKFQ